MLSIKVCLFFLKKNLKKIGWKSYMLLPKEMQPRYKSREEEFEYYSGDAVI
jgi:hypothetical protein